MIAIMGIVLFFVFALSFYFHLQAFKSNQESEIRVAQTEFYRPENRTRDFIAEPRNDKSRIMFISSFTVEQAKNNNFRFEVLRNQDIQQADKMLAWFNFPRKEYVEKQFDYTDRAWYILLMVNLPFFPVEPPCSLEVFENSVLKIPFTLNMDNPDYRVFIELTIQIISRKNGLAYQFTAQQEVGSTGNSSQIRISLSHFVLDKTWQPNIDVTTLPTNQESSFDLQWEGKLIQYQTRLIFIDKIPQFLNAQYFDSLFSSSSLSTNDLEFMHTMYPLQTQNRVLIKNPKTTDLILLEQLDILQDWICLKWVMPAAFF